MRSIKNRLLLRSTSGRLLPTGRKKGRKNKKTIITILFALVAVTVQAQEDSRRKGGLIAVDCSGRRQLHAAV